jgi:hypothetical protein
MFLLLLLCLCVLWLHLCPFSLCSVVYVLTHFGTYFLPPAFPVLIYFPSHSLFSGKNLQWSSSIRVMFFVKCGSQITVLFTRRRWLSTYCHITKALASTWPTRLSSACCTVCPKYIQDIHKLTAKENRILRKYWLIMLILTSLDVAYHFFLIGLCILLRVYQSISIETSVSHQ